MDDVALQHTVEQFLYREARLLASGRFHDWLELFTDDVRYLIPIRETVAGDDVPADDAVAVAHVDEDKPGLGRRVQRLDTGWAHAELPRSRTRHFVANVEVRPAADDEGELDVSSAVAVFQARRDHAPYVFTGERRDRIRRVGSGLRIARRTVLLDHTLLPRSLSIFL